MCVCVCVCVWVCLSVCLCVCMCFHNALSVTSNNVSTILCEYYINIDDAIIMSLFTYKEIMFTKK